ncbi:MAG: beta-ketoacyl synthase N-terminal-like domain-containing protein, partial [Acidobacteriota bacterium]
MRVAITGIGVVSPFGLGRERFWEHVSRGCSGVRAITEFDASQFPCRVAAPVPPVNAADVFAVAAGGGLSAQADPRRYSRV